MWFYLGIFTTVIALIVQLHRKTQLKSALLLRYEDLIPVTHKNYKFNWIPSTDKKPATGYLQIPCKTTLQFSARFENNRDKWAKKIGISYEIQTGHQALDEQIYLASITENDAEYIGKDEKISALILELLSDISDNQYKQKDVYLENEIICDGQVLYLKVKYYAQDNNTKSSFIDKKLSVLKQLATQLENYKNAAPHFWKVPTQRNTAIILAISSTFGILGGLEAVRFFFLDSNQLFHPFSLVSSSLLLALLGLVLLVFFVLKFTKKSARRHLVLFEVCVSGFLGLAFSCYGWLYDANIKLDNSSTRIVSYELSEKYTQTHRRRKSGSYTTYHLRLKDIADPVQSTIKVNRSFYSTISAGDFVRISIKDGYFNQPWMANIEKCNDCNAHW